jgi:hypothetical protein
MSIIKVCGGCKGDGFTRRRPADLHPFTNIAYATLVFADGSKTPFACSDPRQRISQGYEYEFECSKCQGAGEVMWRRGVSLVPICEVGVILD